MELSTSSSLTAEESDENYYEKQVLKLTTIASVSSILANIAISLTIIKYKNLRRDATYVLILHLVLVQIVGLTLDEVLLWFFTYFGTPLPDHHGEFCVIFVGVRMLNAATFLLIVLLMVNWYLRVHRSDAECEFFATKIYKLIIVGIYGSCALMFPVLASYCLRRDVFLTFYFVIGFQVVMIVCSICMTAMQKLSGRDDNNVGLGVANIVVVFCTPAYFFLVLVYFDLCHVYVVLFADVLATGVFPVVLWYLYKYDRNFRMYFKKWFDWRRDVNGSYTGEADVAYNLIDSEV